MDDDDDLAAARGLMNGCLFLLLIVVIIFTGFSFARAYADEPQWQTIAPITDGWGPGGGGRISVHRAEINRLNIIERNTRVRMGRACRSACTMYLFLGPERVCMPRNGRLEFHSAHLYNEYGYEMSEASFRGYLPEVAWQWAVEHDAFASRSYTVMNRETALELGLVSRCEDWS